MGPVPHIYGTAETYVRNGDVSHRDAVGDRPQFDGMAVDVRQAGRRGPTYGSLPQGCVTRRSAVEARATAAELRLRPCRKHFRQFQQCQFT